MPNEDKSIFSLKYFGINQLPAEVTKSDYVENIHRYKPKKLKKMKAKSMINISYYIIFTFFL